MKTKQITLKKNPLHINPYLTHWTGRDKTKEKAFSILEKIISNRELKFGICTTSYPKALVNIKDVMICFTDTPIKLSSDFCEKYNFFGISFNKEKLIQYGANPVLYIVENRKHHQEYLGDLKATNMFPYENNQERNNIAWLLSIMQPYKTVGLEKQNFPQYLEREWRIIRVLPSKLTKASILTGGDYFEPFCSGIRSEENTKKVGVNDFFLKFDPLIVENIIVPISFKDEAIKLMKENKLECELIVINNDIKC
jgi:hypothetical protein